MYDDPVVIKHGDRQLPPLPKIMGRGRKAGFGKYRNIMLRMKIGDSIWDLDEKKCNALKNSAYKCGMKVSTRRIPMTGTYMLMRTA